MKGFMIGTGVLLGFLASACSAGYEEGEESAAQDYEGITQAFSATGSATFSYGTRTAESAGACDRTSAGQVCALPDTKAVKWSFFANSDVTPADATTALNKATVVFQALNGALSANGWSFTKVPFNDPSTTHLIVVDGNFCSGTGSSNIDGYVCHLRTLLAGSLSETLPGEYKRTFRTTTHIDVNDLKAKGTSAAEDNNLLHHAMMHAALAHIGIGMNTLAGTHCSRRAIIPSSVCSTMRAGELCRAKSYTAGGTSFSLTATNCAD